MTTRAWPVRGGRYGIQQLVNGRWSNTTINCGYETVADAFKSIGGLDGYRVIDRDTGEIFTKEAA